MSRRSVFCETARLSRLQCTHLYISYFLKHIPLPNEGDYFM